MLVGEDKPGIGGEPLPGQKLKPEYSVFPKGMGSDAPAWVAFDKQVRRNLYVYVFYEYLQYDKDGVKVKFS